jgi:TonB family protein
VRRFKKPPKTRMAVNEAQPALSVSDRQALIQPVSVDVKVSVENSGKVTHAEVVEFGNPPNWTLANAALAASRRWTFEPVKAEDTPIVNELILHFRFSP